MSSLSSAKVLAGSGYSNKNSYNQEIESARWTMGRGKRRFLTFPLPLSPARFLFFFPFPILPTTQIGLCGGERSELTTVSDACAPKSAGEKAWTLGLLITWLPSGSRFRTFDCPLRNLNCTVTCAILAQTDVFGSELACGLMYVDNP